MYIIYIHKYMHQNIERFHKYNAHTIKGTNMGNPSSSSLLKSRQKIGVTWI